MTRIEENNELREGMMEFEKLNPSGTYEKMAPLHLGIISVVLADISKSLAILADKAGSEERHGSD